MADILSQEEIDALLEVIEEEIENTNAIKRIEATLQGLLGLNSELTYLSEVYGYKGEKGLLTYKDPEIIIQIDCPNASYLGDLMLGGDGEHSECQFSKENSEEALDIMKEIFANIADGRNYELSIENELFCNYKYVFGEAQIFITEKKNNLISNKNRFIKEFLMKYPVVGNANEAYIKVPIEDLLLLEK